MSQDPSNPPLSRSESWKQERKDIKEYKWHIDVHKDKYTDYSPSNIFWYLFNLGMVGMVLVHILLDILMIVNIYSERDFLTNSLKDNPSAVSDICSTNSSSSALPNCASSIQELSSLGIVYIVFTGVCGVIIIYDAIIATKVVLSQDVSDTFINVFAAYWVCMTSYARLCFFQEVGNKKTALDSMSMFLFQTLYQSKQLIADIPMFVVAYLFSSLSGELSDEFSKVSAYAKFVFLAIRFVIALFCFFSYPVVRICVVRGSVRKYASYRIDKLIELVLWPETHPGKIQENIDGAGDPNRNVPPPQPIDVSNASLLQSPPSVPYYGAPQPQPYAVAPGYPGPVDPAYQAGPPVYPVDPAYQGGAPGYQGGAPSYPVDPAYQGGAPGYQGYPTDPAYPQGGPGYPANYQEASYYQPQPQQSQYGNQPSYY